MIVFIFLVALGSDYTIFLMSSVRDEARRHGTREGLLRAHARDRPGDHERRPDPCRHLRALSVLPVWLLFEIGFTVALGVLLDTFLVRSLVVPSLTWLLDDLDLVAIAAERRRAVRGAGGRHEPGAAS